MARIRTIKPEFWTDEKIVELTPMSRLLFIGMWNFCDDYGNTEYSPKQIKMRVFPGDDTDTKPLLDELIAHGMLIEYSVNGDNYLNIPNFLKHQRINRPSPAKHPAPPKPLSLTEHSPPEGKGSGSGSGMEGKGKEGNGREGIGEGRDAGKSRAVVGENGLRAISPPALSPLKIPDMVGTMTGEELRASLKTFPKSTH